MTKVQVLRFLSSNVWDDLDSNDRTHSLCSDGKNDASLDVKSSPRHVAKYARHAAEDARRSEDWLSLFLAGWKNEGISTRALPPHPLPLALGVLSRRWDAARRRILGGAFRGFDGGNQSGKKLNITLRRAKGYTRSLVPLLRRSPNFGPGLARLPVASLDRDDVHAKSLPGEKKWRRRTLRNHPQTKSQTLLFPSCLVSPFDDSHYRNVCIDNIQVSLFDSIHPIADYFVRSIKTLKDDIRI